MDFQIKNVNIHKYAYNINRILKLQNTATTTASVKMYFIKLS